MKTGHIRRAFRVLHSQGQGQQEWQHERDNLTRGASLHPSEVFDINDNNTQHHTTNDGVGGGAGGGAGAGAK